MTGDVEGTPEPLGARLATLAAAVAGLAGVEWSVAGAEALEAAAREVERASRRLHATGCEVAAEVARREEAAGRSAGSAAARLGAAIGVSRGAVLTRVEAGRRAGTPAAEAHGSGRITAAQERAVARWVEELPTGTPEAARRSFAGHLTALAEAGMGTRSLGVVAERELCRVDLTWQSRREQRQAARRAARVTDPDGTGNSVLSVTCDAPLRAVVDEVLARFGSPGRCLSAPADPLTGRVADVSELAAGDGRTAQQRAHDALAHVLRRGLDAGAGSGRGVATVVVRVTPEQLDEIERGRRSGDAAVAAGGGAAGGIVTSSAGSSLSVRQAVGMSRGRSWFVSALRDGREELRRIDVDGDSGTGRGVPRRLASAVQRLVLYAAGDGGCTHPGCEQPAARCQAHHVVEYARGGPTTVANLALVCPTHHGWIGAGAGQWRTVTNPLRPGTPRWIPPRPTAAGRTGGEMPGWRPGEGDGNEGRLGRVA